MRHLALRFLIIAVLVSPRLASAGKLDDFEGELAEPAPLKPPSKSSPGNNGSGYDSDDCVDSLGDIFPCLFFHIVAEAARETYNYSLVREPGTPTIPYARVENYFQTLIDADVNGYAVRGEVGWAFLGLGFEWMRYWEDSPPDRLDSWYVEFLLRLAASENFRLDLAIGGRTFERIGFYDGVQTGFSTAVYGYRSVGLEGDFRWAVVNGRTLSDIRGGVVGRLPQLQYLSLRAGYRLLGIGNQKLHGPEFSLGVTW